MDDSDNNFTNNELRNISGGSILTLFEHNPFIGADILGRDGTIYWSNGRSKLLYFDNLDTDVTGRRLDDFLPTEMAREREDLLRRVCDTGRPVFFRQIWLGKSIVTTYSRLHDTDGQTPLVLVLAGEAGDDSQLRVPAEYLEFEPKHINLGPLDKLSEREIEVLSLLSSGLTTDEIATKLNRSPKTIEAHRSAITRKLGAKNRIQLSKFAHNAKLELRHAKLERVSV